MGPPMIRGAEFSADRSMRFTLLRDWKYEQFEPVAGVMNIIGLNPSDAGETRDDPTARKFVGFGKRWGYSSLVATNVIPVVTSDPWELPPWCGGYPENMKHVRHWMLHSEIVVCAWGSPPRAIRRTVAFHEYILMIEAYADELGIPLFCIGTTRDGSPLHPSRTAYTSRPEVWRAGPTEPANEARVQPVRDKDPEVPRVELSHPR